MSDEAKDQTKAAEVFRELIQLLEEVGSDYAVGGGIATQHYTGGAEHIADIDLVVPEEGTPRIMEELSSIGHETIEMEHSWLHKTVKDGVTVDLMFELKNGMRFDAEFKEHRRRADLFGVRPYVMSPEDQVAALAGMVDRETIGQHWFNIIDIMSNNDMEWDYLARRAEKVPLRMLSVMYFAAAEEVPVRKGVFDQLEQLVIARRAEGGRPA